MTGKGYRFHFGIRGLILATAVAGAIFALIQFLGALIGVAIATLIALIATMIVLFVAVVIRLNQGPGCRDSAAMKRLESAAVWLTVCTMILTATLVFAGGAEGISRVMSRRATKANWESRLGCSMTGEPVVVDGRLLRYIRIESIEPGGVLESYGVRENEVIAVEEQRWYELLERNRGRTMTITLGSGGSSGQWEDFATRDVDFQVPD